MIQPYFVPVIVVQFYIDQLLVFTLVAYITRNVSVRHYNLGQQERYLKIKFRNRVFGLIRPSRRQHLIELLKATKGFSYGAMTCSTPPPPSAVMATGDFYVPTPSSTVKVTEDTYLTCEYVAADGDCFFHSLSALMGYTAHASKTFILRERNFIADTFLLRLAPDSFEAFALLDSGLSLGDYIAHIRTPGRVLEETQLFSLYYVQRGINLHVHSVLPRGEDLDMTAWHILIQDDHCYPCFLHPVFSSYAFDPALFEVTDHVPTMLQPTVSSYVFDPVLCELSTPSAVSPFVQMGPGDGIDYDPILPEHGRLDYDSDDSTSSDETFIPESLRSLCEPQAKPGIPRRVVGFLRSRVVPIPYKIYSGLTVHVLPDMFHVFTTTIHATLGKARDIFERSKLYYRLNCGNFVHTLRSRFERIITAVVVFVTNCTVIESKNILFMNFVNMVSVIMDTEISLLAKKFFCFTTKGLTALFDAFLFPPEAEVQSFGAAIKTLASLRDGVKDLYSSPLVQRFLGIVNYFTASALAATLGLNLPSPSIIKLPGIESGNIALYVMDFIIDLFKGGYQFAVTGNTNAFVHTGAVYADWLNDIARLEHDESMRTSSVNPAKGEVSHADFALRLDRLKEQGEEMLAVVKGQRSSKSDIEKVVNLQSRLRLMESRMIQEQHMGSVRQTPFSILLVGPPGVGKSGLVQRILKAVHNLTTDEPWSDNLVFTHNPDRQFWDGYRTGVLYVILDDLAKINPKLKSGENDVELIISAVNDIAFPLRMADLTSKGRVFFNPRVVISTTNTKSLHTKQFFSYPGAVMRRFDMVINVGVQKEFRKDPTNNTSPLAPESLPNPLTDFYQITIERVKIGSAGQTFDFEIEHKDLTRLETLVVVRQRYKQHQKKVNDVMEAAHAANTTEFCKKCDLPSPDCTCPAIFPAVFEMETQASTGDVVTAIVVTSWLTFLYLCLTKYIPRWLKLIKSEYIMMQDHVLTASELLQRDVKVMTTLGERMNRTIMRGHRHVLYIAAGVLSISGVYVSYRRLLVARKPTFKPLDVEIQGQAPSKADDVDIWRKDAKSLPPIIKKDKGVMAEQVMHKVVSSIFTIRNAKNVQVHCLSLGAHKFLMPYHFVHASIGEQVTIIPPEGNDRVTAPAKFLLRRAQIARVQERDMCVVTIVVWPPMPRISWFDKVNRKIGEKFYVRMLYIDDDRVTYANLQAALVTPKRLLGSPCMTPDPEPMIYYSKQYRGLCGAPLVVIDSHDRLAIVGFHIGGMREDDHDVGLGLQIPLDICTYNSGFLAQASAIPMLEGSERLVTSARYPLPIVSGLHRKSIAHYVGEGVLTRCRFLGEVEFPQSKPRHSVMNTPIRSDVETRVLYPCKHVSPNFRCGHDAGVYNNHYQVALQKIVSSEVIIDPEYLRAAQKAYLADLQIIDFSDVKPLTHEEAINGIDGVKFIDAVNFNAGGGVDVFAKKRKVSSPISDDDHRRKWDDDLQEAIEQMESDLCAGELVRPIFQAHPKDEPVVLKPRPEADVLTIRKHYPGCSDSEISSKHRVNYNFVTHKPKDTRIFTGCPMVWAHIVRKLFLPIMARLRAEPLVTECAVGVNCYSDEWTRFHDFLTAFGENRIVAGDYKAYDKWIPPCIILAVGEVYISLMERARYTAAEINMARAIMQDTAFPRMYINHLLVDLYCSLPSGHPMTVDINSMANSFLIRIVWQSMGYDISSFREHVHLLVYGDDNILGTDFDFPHVKIMKEFAKMGIVYTTASKTDAEESFVNIYDAEFLKRRFLVEEGSKIVRCPLSLDSVVRMLCLRYATDLQPWEHVTDVIKSALGEFFQHGREFFDEHATKLLEIAEENGLEGPFPTYDSLCLRIDSAYQARGTEWSQI